jgi:hypothetical protein
MTKKILGDSMKNLILAMFLGLTALQAQASDRLNYLDNGSTPKTYWTGDRGYIQHNNKMIYLDPRTIKEVKYTPWTYTDENGLTQHDWEVKIKIK